MAQFIVRDVDHRVAAALRARAAANGRSVEAEHRQILRDALMPAAEDVEDFAAAAARLRARLKHDGDSTAILRTARDSRHP
ncbi:MAG: hypothetical protein AAGH83_00550 [Pseudomonadota bacterium]